jgi:ABC-type Mn2+/Zn2+ transport system permease subunit
MQDLWLFLHVLSAIVAFGAFFAGPMVTRSAEGAGVGFSKVTTYVQAPALAVVLLSGIMQAYGMEPREVFKETWISIAFTVWIAMAVVMFFLIKAQRGGTKAVQPLTGVMHLLLVVALWSMVWQPGAPG